MTDPKRSQIGKIGANVKWALTEDRTAATQPARDALYRKFEDQVDPERRLPGPERAKRVENLRRAYYQRLAMKAAESRRAKRAAKAEGVVPPRAAERAAGRVPQEPPGPNGGLQPSPGHEETPGAATPRVRSRKGRTMSETNGTTPTPEGATNAAVLAELAGLRQDFQQLTAALRRLLEVLDR